SRHRLGAAPPVARRAVDGASSGDRRFDLRPHRRAASGGRVDPAPRRAARRRGARILRLRLCAGDRPGRARRTAPRADGRRPGAPRLSGNVRETAMAKNGFRLIDAEMHVMEPTDLWQRYIDPEFAARAPRRLSERRWDIRTMVEGEVMAAMPGGDWPAATDAEEKALGDRYAEEIARDFDPASQVRAMDKEGLDLAILFPTSAMYVTAFSTMDARFAAAACRAYNDWLHDYIQAGDPARMFGAAAVSPHDVDSAVAETRRAVGELGMKAIFIRPNIHNERPWHDRYYDPLWAVGQERDVPVGVHETTGSQL